MSLDRWTDQLDFQEFPFSRTGPSQTYNILSEVEHFKDLNSWAHGITSSQRRTTSSEASPDLATVFRQFFEVTKFHVFPAAMEFPIGPASSNNEPFALAVRRLAENVLQAISAAHDFEPEYIKVWDCTLSLVRQRKDLLSATQSVLPSFLEKAAYGAKLSTSELADFLHKTQKLASNDPGVLNDALLRLDLSKAEPTVAVAVARITSPLRATLSNWAEYIRRLQRALNSKNYDTTTVLQGLI